MLKYVTDAEYQDLLDKPSIPENFNRLVIEASNYINMETFGRIDIKNIPKEVKYITCLIIDLINNAETKKIEMGNLKSQNIEGWSETYIEPKEIDSKLNADKYNLLEMYLWNVIGKDRKPLLYRGVL